MAAVTFYRSVDDNDYEKTIPLAQTGSGIAPIQRRVDDYDIEKFIKALEVAAGIPVHTAIDRKDFTRTLQAVQIKLNLRTVTITIASPAVVTLAAHGWLAGQAIRFQSTGALPTGITVGPTYYVSATGLAAGTFQVSLTPGGPSVNTTGTQSGVHSAFPA